MVYPEVSIIICCHNSADRLLETLTHLCKQQVSSFEALELILVDNASNDQTASIAKKIWQNLAEPFPLFIVTEPKQGLSHARNTGVKKAKGKYLIFCDDDNWLSQNYIAIVTENFNLDEKLAVIGGIGTPIFEDKNPFWFDDFYQGYAVGKQAEETGYLNAVYGAGMSLRKSLYLEALERFGPFMLSGRTGAKLLSGEDSEICLRLKIMGYKIKFIDNLRFHHFLTKERLTITYLKNLHAGFTYSYIPLLLYELAISQKAISNLYWAEKSFFYYGRAIKYSLLNLFRRSSKIQHIKNHINIKHWLILGNQFLSYNFKLKSIYYKIQMHNKKDGL